MLTKFSGPGTLLGPSDYADAAAMISVPVATIRGVCAVEASGSGFDAAKRPKLLFEPHVFYARLPRDRRATAVAQNLAYPKWGMKPYPKTSQGNYDRLNKAMQINSEVALQSASWGLFQVMGYNAHDCGYNSAAQMIEAFVNVGEPEMLDAFIRLIDAWNLEDELQRRDAAGFAKRYNGPGFAKNSYDTKLRNAWRLYDKNSKQAKVVALLSTDDSDDDAVSTDTRSPHPSDTGFEEASPKIPVSVVGDPAPDGGELAEAQAADDDQSGSTPDVVSKKPVAVPPAPGTADDGVEITDPAVILKVQQQLRDLGYSEVGVPTNAMGSFAQAAVLAFRNDNQMPLSNKVTTALVVKLATAKQRTLSTNRTMATSGTIRSRVPEAAMAFKGKIAAFIAAAGAWIASAIDGIGSWFGIGKGQIEGIKSYFGDVPGWVWLVGIGVLATCGFLIYGKAQQQSEDAYKSGDRR